MKRILGILLVLLASSAAGEAPEGKDLYGDPLPPGVLLRLGTVRLRQPRQEECRPIFSPDGSRLASGGMEDTVRVWEASTGVQLLKIGGHSGGVRCLAFSPDGKSLASADGDGSLHVRDALTGKDALPRLQTHQKNPTRLAYSPDGAFLLMTWDAPDAPVGRIPDSRVSIVDLSTGRISMEFKGHRARDIDVHGRRVAIGGKEIHLWDAAKTGGHATLVPDPGPPAFLALSPDGKLLAWGTADGTLALWDFAADRKVFHAPRRPSSLAQAPFSPDGKTLASADGPDVCLWETATGKLLARLKGHGAAVTCLRFSGDGHVLASGGTDHEIRLWDLASRSESCCLRGHAKAVQGLELSADGRVLASMDINGGFRLWGLLEGAGEGKESLKLEIPNRRMPGLSPDGKLLAAGFGNALKLWDTATGKEASDRSGHEDEVLALAWSADGRTLASGGEDQAVRVWEASTGKVLAVRHGHRNRVNRLIFLPDGVLGSGSTDGAVLAWHPGEEDARERREPAGQIYAFSEDGKLEAADAFNHRLRFLETNTGRELFQIPLGDEGWVVSARFSPDGKILATGMGDKTLRLWDTQTGKELAVMKGHPGQVYSLAFTPDGKRLAAGDGMGGLALWDLASGKPVYLAGQKGGAIQALAFSPDGKVLAASDGFSSIHLKDAATGAALKDLPGHEGVVRALAFSPDGRRLASASDDTTVLIWDLAGGKP